MFILILMHSPANPSHEVIDYFKQHKKTTSSTKKFKSLQSTPHKHLRSLAFLAHQQNLLLHPSVPPNCILFIHLPKRFNSYTLIHLLNSPPSLHTCHTTIQTLMNTVAKQIHHVTHIPDLNGCTYLKQTTCTSLPSQITPAFVNTHPRLTNDNLNAFIILTLYTSEHATTQ